MGISAKASGGEIGDTKYIAHSNVSADWLLCFGQAISRTAFSALFNVVGVAFGVGDGSTTFNLPDGRGRALFAKDDMGGTAANRLTAGGGGINGATLGAVGGGETATLTAAQMPNHVHQEQSQGTGTTVIPTVIVTTGATTVAGRLGGGGEINSSSAGSLNTAAAGSSGAHTNLPPALILNLIIKAF